MRSDADDLKALCWHLRRIGREVHQMAGRINRVHDAAAESRTPDLRHGCIDKMLQYAKEQYQLRRRRSEFLPRTIFAEPAWDILLDLFISERTGKTVSIKSACVASGVPMTTALRAISVLEAKGLVERYPDKDDRRRVHLLLSDKGHQSLCDLLEYQLSSDRAVWV